MSDEPPKTLGSPMELLTPAIEQSRKRFLARYKEHGPAEEEAPEGTTAKEMRRRNGLLMKKLRAAGLSKQPDEHIPTEVFRRQVQMFRAMGYNQGKIADLLMIGEKTLRKHYKWELENGVEEYHGLIAANLMQIAAMPGHRDAAKVGMWWLERRAAEFRPTRGVEVTGANGGPVTTQALAQPPVLDSRKMTYEQRQKMRALLNEIAETQGLIEAPEGDSE